jgi:hypothetical protein
MRVIGEEEQQSSRGSPAPTRRAMLLVGQDISVPVHKHHRIYILKHLSGIMHRFSS